MRRALVTGESGFIGTHLVDALRGENTKVVTLGRRKSADGNHVYLEPGEWNGDRLAKVLEFARPDAIFHLAGAARGTAEELLAINAGLTRSLLLGIERAGLSPVVISAGSAAEYGAAIKDGEPVTEDASCEPLAAYGISKLAQTMEVLDFGARRSVPVLAARIFNAIGPGMPRHLALGDFAYQIAAAPRQGRFRLSVGNLETRRDMIDVSHVALVLSRLARQPDARGIVNVCSGVAPRLRSLVDNLISASGRDVVIDVDPSRLRPNELAIIVGSTDRLSKLNCSPPPTDFPALVESIWRFAERPVPVVS